MQVENELTRFKRTMVVDPIIDGVKLLSEVINPNVEKVAGAKYLGSIDPLTASNLAKECGYGIGTKGFAVYVKKQLLNGRFSKYKANLQKRFY